MGWFPSGDFPRPYQVPDATADLERALNLLKQGPLFRATSRRLLYDLVERSGVQELHAPSRGEFLTQWVDEDLDREGPVLAIVVLQGTLIAAKKPPPGTSRVPYPSPLPPEVAGHALELEVGVHLRGELKGFAPEPDDLQVGNLRFEPPDGRIVRFLIGTAASWGGCPAVAWNVNIEALPASLWFAVQVGQRPELIWIAKPATLDVSLEGLMHVVAGQIASDLPAQRAALVTLDASPETATWTGDRFEDANTPLGTTITAANLYGLVGGLNVRGRVFVLNSKDPMSEPARLSSVGFDRIIYVDSAIPDKYPPSLKQILKPEVLDANGEPLFNSFATAVVTGVTRPPTRFAALPVSPTTPSKKKPDPRLRLTRDACVLRLTGDLKAAWDQWMKNGGLNYKHSFLFSAIDSGAIEDSTSGRWARAVTQRRIGLAVSGGGASAYRVGPILDEFDKQNVPIDVFSGLSGSALVGAFYCCDGAAGFNTVKMLGPLFQLTLPLVLSWTWPLEAVVDLLLRCSRVEDMEMRFAPVTVALPDTDRPQAGVVVKGSLGAAVRTSGALPPSFAPTIKNWVRYADGGAGTAVPARVTRDFGADVTMAVNAIPGPQRGNPYGGLPGGWLLHQMPILGRMLDSYTWYAFFWEQTSAEFGREAEVFVDFEPQWFPMLESSAFVFAQWIADAAAKQTRTQGSASPPAKIVEALKKKWQELGG